MSNPTAGPERIAAIQERFNAVVRAKANGELSVLNAAHLARWVGWRRSAGQHPSITAHFLGATRRGGRPGASAHAGKGRPSRAVRLILGVVADTVLDAALVVEAEEGLSDVTP